MLTFVMKPLVERHLAGQLREELNLPPAAIFYLTDTAGLITLILYPALKSATYVILPAAILGEMGYGTYEFTSYAVMKNWSLTMVATDLTWGHDPDRVFRLGRSCHHPCRDADVAEWRFP